MASKGIALYLEGAKLQLATITVPVAVQGAAAAAAAGPPADAEPPPDLLPQPLPPSFAALAAALAAVRRAATDALPFIAHVAGADSLRIICQKARVGDVFRLLRAQQAALGIVVKDVKSHVNLLPPAGQELAVACAAGVAAALAARGWWRLDEQCLLSACPLEPSPDGQPVTAGSVQMEMQLTRDDKGALALQLNVLPEQVEWRHPACRPGASLEARSERLAGTLCTLLPDLRPAVIQRLRPADAATLARLRPLWAAHGQPLPEGADTQPLAEVCLDCDPDAPSYPIPACRLLGQYGLQSTASKLSSLAVQSVVAKLRDDLAASPFKPLGEGLRFAKIAREWFPEGHPPLRGRQAAAAAESAAQPAAVFMTARQHEEQAKGRQQQAREPALGAEIDVSAFKVDAAGAEPGQRARRQYTHVPPKLQATWDAAKRQNAEAERPARAATAAAPAAPAFMLPPAGSAAGITRPQLPALQRAAAAAAAGGSQKPAVPTFKKVGAAAAAGAAPKKAAAAGQKRAGGAKAGAKPAAPKRPKATAITAPAATSMVGGAAAAGSAGAGNLPSSRPASAAAPPSTAKPQSAETPAIPRGKLASTAADAGGMGAAAAAAAAAPGGAPAKPPPKPRAKPADVDVAAVTAKVHQMHAVGTLGKLTIPEMKAYLKSIKQPVGGKKGDLEERVRASLGSRAAPAVAAAEA
ncbi:hypothetical protein ABPG75_012504 [Micractinium tetrahymenae]